MNDETIAGIEKEITSFIRRIILSEKRLNGLDRSTYVILRQLETYGPAGVKQLSVDLQLDSSTISRQAATLVEKNYAVKEPNPADGRSYFYRITDLGEKELEANRERRYERLRYMLSEWPEADRKMFGQLLQRYNEGVEELHE
ncbi:MarR family winged helix-turn-helix transcriptional regulator [Virgibacillus siamensis]|uniref:MarR family winged helix-turn-helix transcriptional regulator n=1 Tax=Virgibacillus siamensis TaxID=480071 RepID=UPI000986D027|nr:MarR family transcriptional regulator [Virgibacillus siamensis]